MLTIKFITSNFPQQQRKRRSVPPLKLHTKTITNTRAQSAAEYVIVLLLAAVIVGSSYDLFSRALGSFYNKLLSARSGTTGMAP